VLFLSPINIGVMLLSLLFLSAIYQYVLLIYVFSMFVCLHVISRNEQLPEDVQVRPKHVAV
jgi:hypothetical protein